MDDGKLARLFSDALFGGKKAYAKRNHMQKTYA